MTRKTKSVLIIYLILVVLSFVLYLTRFEFNSFLNVFNLIIPVLAILVTLIGFIVFVFKKNRVKVKALRYFINTLSCIPLLFILFNYTVFFIVFIMFDPGSCFTVTSPAGKDFVFVSRKYFHGSNTTIYRGYGPVRKHIGIVDTFSDDASRLISDNHFDVQWNEDSFILAYPEKYDVVNNRDEWKEQVVYFK